MQPYEMERPTKHNAQDLGLPKDAAEEAITELNWLEGVNEDDDNLDEETFSTLTFPTLLEQDLETTRPTKQLHHQALT